MDIAVRKNSGSHIDAPHSRQPLVTGERLVRYEVNAVMPVTLANTNGLIISQHLNLFVYTIPEISCACGVNRQYWGALFLHLISGPLYGPRFGAAHGTPIWVGCQALVWSTSPDCIPGNVGRDEGPKQSHAGSTYDHPRIVVSCDYPAARTKQYPHASGLSS